MHPEYADYDDSDAARNGTPKPLPAWQKRTVAIPDEWFVVTPPPREWIGWDRRTNSGIIPAGTTGQLSARGGAGKTQALIQLMIAVATGRRWLDTIDMQRGRVFALFGEEVADEVRRRSHTATIDGPKPPPGSIVVAPLFGLECALLAKMNGQSVHTGFLDELNQYLVENGPWALIILDPLSRLGGPDAEIDNATATMLVEVVESIAVLTGATVIVAHHIAKAYRRDGVVVTAEASRGATALTDGFRFQFSLSVEHVEEIGEVITLGHTKHNYSQEAKPVLLKRGNGGRLVSLTDAEIEVVEEARSGKTDRQAKREEREAEANTARARKTAKTEAAREEVARKREAGAADKRIAEERALVAVVRERPGITSHDLRSALAARLGSCSRDRAYDIVERLGAAVAISTPEGAKAGTKAHTLVESQLREELR